MIVSHNIQYITHHHIERDKWDHCVTAAANSLIYANSWWLDSMSPNWDALVLNDYEMVMPLTWNKKWGFYYLYQPFFTPALGVFGNNATDISGFLNAIPHKFKYWDIDLNETNTITGHTTRVNYMLALNRPYDEIRKAYKRLATRMIKKAAGAGLEIISNISPSQIIDLYRKEYKKKHPGIADTIYDQLKKCTAAAFEKGNAQTYIAKYSSDIVGFYLLLKDNAYIYSLLGGSTGKGQSLGAFYALTDAAIRDHSNSNRIFRFEGSDVPGIAFFDKQFGPELTYYTHIKQNNLPFPANLLKRIKETEWR